MDNANQYNIYELTEAQRELAECIGVENYVKLTECFGGSFIYIGKSNAMSRQTRNEKIIEDFEKGATYKQLAFAYGLTEVWIRVIVDGRN